MNEFELAQKFKKPVNEIRKNLDYVKKHPFDLMQPSDPRFNDIWGKKQKQQREKIERGKKDSELAAEDMKRFEERKKSIDKVHKKYHF